MGRVGFVCFLNKIKNIIYWPVQSEDLIHSKSEKRQLLVCCKFQDINKCEGIIVILPAGRVYFNFKSSQMYLLL